MVSRCVIVLGSHRSGTSVLTRAQLAVGVDLGECLYGPRSDNQKGFFEDKFANQQNEAFLARIDRRWHSLLAPEAIDHEVISDYQRNLQELILERFEGKPLWGLKDPRISRLWPYWVPVLVEAGVKPVFILANRHPYSVALSLFKRDRMPEAHALALWAIHQLDALEALLQHGGLVVDYDSMVDHPRQELQRIASFLGVEAQLDPYKLAEFESDFLTAELRHSCFPTRAELSTTSPLQALCLAIYDGLSRLAHLPGGMTSDAIDHSRALAAEYRGELLRSIDWMRAVDVLQAGLAQASGSPSGVVVDMNCEIRLNISAIVEGAPQACSESRGTAMFYPVSNQRQSLRMLMPADLRPLERIRINPANHKIALWLHHMALVHADGRELWHWDGDAESFENIAGLAMRTGAEGLLLLCLNDDSQFDLAVPAGVLSGLAANVSLVVELTPQPLIDVFSDILRQDDGLIAQLRTDLLKGTGLGVTSPEGSATVSMHLASDLKNIASQLNYTLAERDQNITRLSMQLEKMREELLRAEGQLDLLKDVMLGGREDDRL